MVSGGWLNPGLGRKWAKSKLKQEEQRFILGCSREVLLDTK